MKLIVGLGNIGREYEQTRHNIGFMVADELARRFNVSGWQEKWQGDVAQVFLPTKVVLLKPRTYMNLSGNAVREVVNFYNISTEDIIVIQDDLDLPCGQLRIREKGGAGGHNGLKSIIQNLTSLNFPRIRIGIGHPQGTDKQVIKHVLNRFSPDEQPLIQQSVNTAAQALAELCAGETLARIMSKYNPPRVKKAKPAAIEPEAGEQSIGRE